MDYGRKKTRYEYDVGLERNSRKSSVHRNKLKNVHILLLMSLPINTPCELWVAFVIFVLHLNNGQLGVGLLYNVIQNH